jgi:hypothetical protein
VDEATRRARREQWRRRRRAQIRRRRAVALAVVAILLGLAISTLEGGGAEGERSAAEAKPPPMLPRGGRSMFPEFRVVGFYGAPQNEELGELGIGKPDSVARRLERQAQSYAGRGRPPVLPAFELIAAIANRTPGDDGKYRSRQRHEVIERYLAAARRGRDILILDIQPGRADFLDEVRQLDPILAQPDVSLALDPEWHMGEGEVPGQSIGSVTAHEVNEVAKHLSGIIQRGRLPEKVLVVHQFTADMIENRRELRPYPGVALTLNVDGFGDPALKARKYREFVRRGGPGEHGFKLFYREDTGLMSPEQVLRLRPQPALVVYE